MVRRFRVVFALPQFYPSSAFSLFFCVCEGIFASDSVSPGGAGYLRTSLDRTRESVVEKVDALGYGLSFLSFFLCV